MYGFHNKLECLSLNTWLGCKEMPVDQLSVGQMSVHSTVDQMSVDQMSVDKISPHRSSWSKDIYDHNFKTHEASARSNVIGIKLIVLMIIQMH